MKLLVDMGNTRVKWACLEHGRLQAPGSASQVTPLPALLESMVVGQKPEGIRLASVAAPAATAALSDALTVRHGVPVQVVATGTAAHGVTNGYLEPRQLGVDRWLAMVAAYARHRRALCVVDAGTAVTIDAVAADGRHLGGFIVPGPALMRGALLRATGGISAAADLVGGASAPAGGWSRDTESGMRLGALRAVAGLVESCVTVLSQDALLVVTGGDAPLLLSALSIPAQHAPLLVLEGLALS